MKVGVIIFIVLICGIVLVELVSLIKTIIDKAKKKKIAKLKVQQDVLNVPVADKVEEPKEN